MNECNLLDTKNKRGCKPRGLNIEPVEKFLISKGGYAKPIGLALKKEYGKRVSQGEYIKKGMMSFNGDSAFTIESMGLAGNLNRVNRKINEQIKKEAKKHLK